MTKKGNVAQVEFYNIDESVLSQKQNQVVQRKEEIERLDRRWIDHTLASWKAGSGRHLYTSQR